MTLWICFHLPRLADQYMEGLHIKEHANKYTKACSGGTNRKLSYAMAMLGSPKIVLLDEPSTGMDPMSKRFVWDTVLASFKEERGAILTTHSMEEADALCNRPKVRVCVDHADQEDSYRTLPARFQVIANVYLISL